MNKNIKTEMINVAFELFKKEGYDQVTVNDICQKCHVTKPTFYRYISSKEEILTHFFDQIHDELEDLAMHLATASNYWQQIIYVFDLIINRMQFFTKELYAQLYISNLKNDHHTFAEIKVVKELVTVLIDKAQQSHQIHNPGNPEELYEMCSVICFGCGIKWCLNLIDDVHASFVQDLAHALHVDHDLLSCDKDHNI